MDLVKHVGMYILRTPKVFAPLFRFVNEDTYIPQFPAPCHMDEFVVETYLFGLMLFTEGRELTEQLPVYIDLGVPPVCGILRKRFPR